MEINEVLALIDKIIAEHKTLLGGLAQLDQGANDALALAALEEGTQKFVPGRFDQRETAQKLAERLEGIDRGLRAHFSREETGLSVAVVEYGDEKMTSALRALLMEHKDLRTRLAESKERVAELGDSKFSTSVWIANAHDARAHIAHTRKLLEAHAGLEQELIGGLRKTLKERAKR